MAFWYDYTKLIASILSTIGASGMVLTTVIHLQSKKQTTNIILMFMAISDILFSSTSFIIQLIKVSNNVLLTSISQHYSYILLISAIHYAFELSSFLWTAALAFYILKLNRKDFKLHIAHWIIWICVLSYYIAEVYTLSYKGFVSSCDIRFQLVRICWDACAIFTLIAILIALVAFAHRSKQRLKEQISSTSSSSTTTTTTTSFSTTVTTGTPTTIKNFTVLARLRLYLIAFIVLVTFNVINDIMEISCSSIAKFNNQYYNALGGFASSLFALLPLANSVIYASNHPKLFCSCLSSSMFSSRSSNQLVTTTVTNSYFSWTYYFLQQYHKQKQEEQKEEQDQEQEQEQEQENSLLSCCNNNKLKDKITKDRTNKYQQDQLQEIFGLTIGEKIGEGLAVVYKGNWRGINVAVKMRLVYYDDELNTCKEFQKDCNEEIQQEAAKMRNLRHPNIVLFMEVGFFKGSLCIISEYCYNGSLRDVLERTRKDSKDQLEWPMKLRLALGIAYGLQYLHNASPSMIHRDLKSPNILVDETWHSKVADFGTLRFSEIVYLRKHQNSEENNNKYNNKVKEKNNNKINNKIKEKKEYYHYHNSHYQEEEKKEIFNCRNNKENKIKKEENKYKKSKKQLKAENQEEEEEIRKKKQRMTCCVGTTRWMAPEIIQGSAYDEKADIFSFGSILWEMIEGNLPYEDIEWNHTIEELILQGKRPEIPIEKCPNSWKVLIEKCWKSNPKDRPTSEEILESIQQISKEEIWDCYLDKKRRFQENLQSIDCDYILKNTSSNRYQQKLYNNRKEEEFIPSTPTSFEDYHSL